MNHAVGYVALASCFKAAASVSMKKTSPLAALVAATFALSSAVPAMAATPGAISSVRLSLQLKTSAPGTFVRNPDGGAFVRGENNQLIPTVYNQWSVRHDGKFANLQESITEIVTTRYGNRELLEDLLQEGVLPDHTIRGWSIKMLGTPGNYLRLNLYKQGQEKKSLASVLPLPSFSFEETPGLVSATHLHGRETFLADSFQWKGAMEGITLLNFTPVKGLTFELQGEVTASAKKVKLGKYSFYPCKISMPQLTGYHTETKTYIKGSLMISPGVVKSNVNPY